MIRCLAISGGRAVCDVSPVLRDLERLRRLGLGYVTHGACPQGVDAYAALACDMLGIRQVPKPVTDEEWRPGGVLDVAAGHRRNERMLDEEKPDVLLAYPALGSRGTWHCVAAALQRGIVSGVYVPEGVDADNGRALARARLSAYGVHLDVSVQHRRHLLLGAPIGLGFTLLHALYPEDGLE